MFKVKNCRLQYELHRELVDLPSYTCGPKRLEQPVNDCGFPGAWASQVALVVKNLRASAGDERAAGDIRKAV